jgi:hypothetical protein
MNNTTPGSILITLTTTVAGLTPAGGTTYGTNDTFTVLEDDDYAEDPYVLAETELDRRFMFHGLTPNILEIHSVLSTSVHRECPMTLVIGHQVGDYRNTRDRRDRDLYQLATQLTRAENFPTGVHIITFEGGETSIISDEDSGHHWWSTLRFAVTFSMAADYGG